MILHKSLFSQTLSSNIKTLLTFLIVLFIFSSCDEVIDLKLENADPKIVIEGNVNDQLENHYVRISKSIPFVKTNTFNGFKGAKVTLSTTGASPITFTEVSDGLYKSVAFKGLPGKTYKLEVLAEGKVYSAESTMPMPVVPDSVSIKKISFFGNTRIFPIVFYKDPAVIQNQYRYILKINNKYISDIVSEDRFNDGNEISDIIAFEGEDIKIGDNVDIEMQSIDRKVFKYYFAISQIDGNGGPPVAPANPDSNFNNGALGIFNAHTKSSLNILVK
jgi:hypothetical protein